MKLFHVMTVPLTLGFVANQIGFMKSNGVEVHIVCSPGEELETLSKTGRVTTHAITMLRKIAPAHDFISLIRLFALFRQEDPNIVHAHTPKAGLLAMIAAWLARVPCRVFHIHGLPHSTMTGFARFALKWSTKFSCVFSTQVLSVSRSASDLAIEEGLCPEGKIYLPGSGSISGVDAERQFVPVTDRKTNRREMLGCAHTDQVIGFVGRLARDKGIDELYRSWSEIREEFPNSILVIAGEPDERDPAPPHVLEAFRSDERVRMLGWVRDTASVYGCLDVLLLPSYREGFGNVILEAAAMQVPCVASRITGCVDAVLDGVTGLLVKPRDHVELTNAIRMYLGDPSLRLQHGRHARARVLREFKPEDVWQAMLRQYQLALSRRGSGVSPQVSGGVLS